MPYFGGDKTERYAIREDGRGMVFKDFLALAEGSRVNHKEFLKLDFRLSLPEIADGPPCLEHLCSVGIGEGSRNNGLFALGVLAKKMDADNWEILLDKWNQDYLKPPLSTDEVGLVIKSLRKKDYVYKCKDAPIVSHCNVAICRDRKYGVGPSGGTKIVDSISVLDSNPPLFFVTLATGGVVECDATAILTPRDFQRLALMQLRLVLPLFKLDEWLDQIQKCMTDAVVIDAPKEVGIDGRFEEILEQFCTDRHAAQSADEILLGKPWLDDETGRVWFRLKDLQDMMERQRFRELSRGQVTTRIRTMGGGTKFTVLRGKGVNLWYVPKDQLQWQTATLDPKRGEESPL